MRASSVKVSTPRLHKHKKESIRKRQNNTPHSRKFDNGENVDAIERLGGCEA